MQYLQTGKTVNFILHFYSNAIWEREVMLLQIPYKGTTMDLAANTLLYHISPVEFQARVYCLYAHCCKVSYFLKIYIRENLLSWELYCWSFWRWRNHSSLKSHWKTFWDICKQGISEKFGFWGMFLNHPRT